MVIWFRRDLRVEDNRALALARGRVLPIFIFDKNILDKLEKEDKRVTFIFNRVEILKKNLKKIGLNLTIFFAKPIDVFEYLKSQNLTKAVASVDFNEYSKTRDNQISNLIDLELINDSFIFEPNEILNQNGNIYRVFTPFYKKVLESFNESYYLEYREEELKLIDFDFENLMEIRGDKIYKREISLKSLGFKKANIPTFIENNPIDSLKSFKNSLNNYTKERDYPSLDSTSKLSTHLRFGTISIRYILRELKEYQNSNIKVNSFFRQLIWREFFNLIFETFPHTKRKNFLDIEIPWENDEDKFQTWTKGETGVPIVDAGMRELNSTGYMHNRLRMIVSSFLVKDLRVAWQKGERYFSKKLLDYEPSSNVLSWQWASSIGIDAVPYFRIFNPYLQSKKFDRDGIYIKSWIEELKDTPSKHLHNEAFLMQYRIKNYPTPIIEHKREANLTKEIFKKAFSKK